MITKYKTNYSKDEIIKVDVIRETEKCVFLESSSLSGRIAEQRESKVSSYTRYHDTWGDAHSYLLGCANSLVSSKESQFKAAKDKLAKVESLKAQQ